MEKWIYESQVKSRGGGGREWRGPRHCYLEERLHFKAGGVGRAGISVSRARTKHHIPGGLHHRNLSFTVLEAGSPRPVLGRVGF